MARRRAALQGVLNGRGFKRDVRAVNCQRGLAAAGLKNDTRLARTDERQLAFAARNGHLLVVGAIGNADGVAGSGRIDGGLDG